YVFFRPEFYIPTLIDAMARIVRTHPKAGLVIMGSDAGADPIREQIRRLDLDRHDVLAGDQPHDAALTIMTTARMYIRTPRKDGVCSSVLEALALGVPVVASENGTRPASVVTYKATDPDDLAAKVEGVLADEAAAR